MPHVMACLRGFARRALRTVETVCQEDLQNASRSCQLGTETRRFTPTIDVLSLVPPRKPSSPRKVLGLGTARGLQGRTAATVAYIRFPSQNTEPHGHRAPRTWRSSTSSVSNERLENRRTVHRLRTHRQIGCSGREGEYERT